MWVSAINGEAATILTGVPLGGEGWLQLGELGLALLLSACIGLEREIRMKNAGMRTHTLVGLGAALFVLVSKYGFSDVIETGRIILDPSRMAAHGTWPKRGAWSRRECDSGWRNRVEKQAPPGYRRWLWQEAGMGQY